MEKKIEQEEQDRQKIRNKGIEEFMRERIKVRFKELDSFIEREAFMFLDEDVRSLLLTSILLQKIFKDLSEDIKPEKELRIIDMDLITDDYSFIAFPAAKAFEGYLKCLLIKLRLLKKSELKKDPFKSIGVILNSKEFEQKVKDKRFRHIPKEIQAEWDKSRNYILHYDIDRPSKVSKTEANDRISAILKAIKESYNAFYGVI